MKSNKQKVMVFFDVPANQLIKNNGHHNV
jgi:hypothetical protein